MARTGLLKAVSALTHGLQTKFTADPYISEAAVIVPADFRNNSGPPGWMFAPNGIDYKFEYSGLASAATAYQTCPPLAAIINRKAQAFINGRTIVVNTKKKEVTGPLPGNLKTLLSTPNPLESWKEFESKLYMNMQLASWCFVMPIYSAGFEVLGPAHASSFWVIPTYMVSWKEISNVEWYKAKKLSDIVPSIRLKYKDLDVTISTEFLLFFKDIIPSFSSQVFPESRIKPLSMPINNIIAAYESRNELINYAGSQGILTPKTDSVGPIPLKPGEKEQLQADFKRQYGIKKGQSRYIISPAPMDWQPMGKDTKSLMLFEEVIDDIMRLCDGLGYPSPLLNTEKGPNVSSADSFKKQVYEDTIIPDSLNIYEQWNNQLKLIDTPYTLQKNYDHLPILQQDAVLEGQATLYTAQACLIQYQNNLITLNQWRITQNIETTPDGDVYYSDSVQKQQADAAAQLQAQQLQSQNAKKPTNEADNA